MNRDDLFLATMDDLDERLAAAEEYDALRAAALVRQLLLDGAPLVHQVNRERRVKVVFRVGDLGAVPSRIPPGAVGVRFMVDGLYPDQDLGRIQVVHEVGLDGFLGHPVGHYGDEPITIADVVKYLAHVEGGVHAGEPASEVDSNLARMAAAVRVGGLTAPVRVMRSIGRITRDALVPLRKAVDVTRREGSD